MRSNYKKLGSYIRPVDERNSDGSLGEDNLYGISVTKDFIVTHANLVGVTFDSYKVVAPRQFAYIPDTSRRGDKIAISLNTTGEKIIVSSICTVFEIADEDQLLPEYLMLWFTRPEFDRYARFMSNGSAREVFDWDCMCGVELPVPPLPEQQKIVRDYQVITDRIVLLRQVNEKLEEAEQTILLKTLSMEETIMTPLGDIADFIDGDRGKNYPTFDEFYEEGYCLFLSAANVTSTGFNFENCVFVTEEKDKAMNKGHLCRYDIVLTSRGTLGNVAFYDGHVPYENVRINSGMLILRPKCRDISPYFLYALLKSNYMRIEIEKFKSGSAQPQLPIRDLQKVSFPIPVDGQDLVSLSANLRVIQETISLYTNEIDTLKRAQRSVLAKMSTLRAKGA